MEVKEGYKKTDIGVIPEIWDVKTFKDVSWVNQGLQISIENRRKHSSIKSKVYITIQYLKNHKDVEYIDNYSSSVCCEKNDLLMTRTGNTGDIVTNVEGVFHNNFFKINFDKKQIQREFLLFFLQQNQIQHIILTKAGTNTIPDLNHSDFYTIPVFLPPLPEQRTIATALSDADAHISSLEQVIAMMRDIKQATMQDLLTGKRRLPGFSGVWGVKRFDQVFKKQNAKNHQIQTREYCENGSYPVIDQGKNAIVAYSDQSKKLFRPPQGGVIIFGDHTRIVKYADFDFLVGADGAQILTIEEKNSTKFFYYQLCVKEIPNTGYNRHYKFLKEMSFLVPTLPEQLAIATVLSDMDAELTALEQQLDKTKAIKQGMMQELLTGRIRLV